MSLGRVMVCALNNSTQRDLTGSALALEEAHARPQGEGIHRGHVQELGGGPAPARSWGQLLQCWICSTKDPPELRYWTNEEDPAAATPHATTQLGPYARPGLPRDGPRWRRRDLTARPAERAAQRPVAAQTPAARRYANFGNSVSSSAT